MGGSSFKPLAPSSLPPGFNTTRALDRQRALGLPAKRTETTPQTNTPSESPAAAPRKPSADSISLNHPKVLADAQFIHDSVKRGVGSAQEAESVVALLHSYEVWDNTLAAANPEHEHGNLDAIFWALGRMSAFDDGIVFSHYRLPTDILWFDLAEPYRDEYRRLYRLSALGAHRAPDEGTNYGKEFAKGELIGVLGILKGVAVGAAGLVDDARFVIPATGKDPNWASEGMSTTFDDAAEWWVGKDWKEGEEVLLGLNAAEMGEIGGTLVFTLASLEVKALKLTQSILMYPAMARSMDGMLDRLGKVYLEDRDAAKSAASDPRLWQEIVGIAGSIIGLLLSRTASGQRIGTKLAHFLLDAAPIAPIVGKIVEAALSADPPEAKRRAIGLALSEMLQMAAAIAGGKMKDRKLGGGGNKTKAKTPLPNEPPPNSKGYGAKPLTDSERALAEKMLNQKLGLATAGPAVVKTFPKRPAPEGAGQTTSPTSPEAQKAAKKKANLTPKTAPGAGEQDFKGWAKDDDKQGPMVVVRSTPDNPLGSIVLLADPKVTDRPRSARNEELPRAMKAAGMGLNSPKDWDGSYQSSHVLALESGGAEAAYNREPGTKAYNHKNRRSAEIALKKFLADYKKNNQPAPQGQAGNQPQKDPRVTVVVDRWFKSKYIIEKELFTVYDADGNAIFERGTTARGKAWGFSATPAAAPKAAKQKKAGSAKPSAKAIAALPGAGTKVPATKKVATTGRADLGPGAPR